MRLYNLKFYCRSGFIGFPEGSNPIIKHFDETYFYRERNREHAKKSRSKKKDYTKSLEEALKLLREENAKLKNAVYAHFGKEKTKEMVQKRLESPTVKFVEALKNPSNRIMTKSAVTYLKSLSHDCQLRR